MAEIFRIRILFLICFLLAYVSPIKVSAAASQQENKARFFQLSTADLNLTVTNYGATVVSLKVPDAKGKAGDVVLGYDKLSPYLNGSDGKYFGAIVGRVANRIKDAQFELDGKVYHLPANDGKNTLHGGFKGFDKVLWSVESMKLRSKYPFIQFSYHSYDGEQGFPGAVNVSVKYMIKRNELRLDMTAKPLNKATPINLAQHTYWNLAGEDSGRSVLGNRIQISANFYTPVDAHLIPTGAISPVKDTAYDFTKGDIVGSRIDRIPGYDINYVLDPPKNKKKKDQLRHAVTVKDDFSGRAMEIWTDAPGLQFYTGGMLNYVVGKKDGIYVNRSGMCLETQHFPDSVHHPDFPSVIYRPGQVYKHVMLYKFTAHGLSCK